MSIPLEILWKEYPYLIDIFNRLSDAVYICDRNGNLIYINKAAEELDGYSLSDVYGRPVQETYGLDKETSPLLRALTQKEPVVDSVFRYYVNGREIVQVCNAGPLLIGEQVVGGFTIQRDETKIKEIIERNISLQKEIFDNHEESGEKTKEREDPFSMLLGEDPQFKECKKMALQAARGDSSVMITSKTGCGKELFAKCIHYSSSRKNGPFLAVNCAAIPESLLESLLMGTSKGVYTGAVEREGLFEQAEGGTLFLDEINSMPLASQSKLLRVLEDKIVQHLGSSKKITVNVRIISSSNSSPQEAIVEGQIRADLFYRLSVVNIMIPALAERQGDVFLLANHFISVYNERFKKHILSLDDEVLSFFLDFDWPGNIRQLKHCIESAMNFVDDSDYTIKKHHLPHYILKEQAKGFTGYHQKTNRESFIPGTNHIGIEGEKTVRNENVHVFSDIREKEKQDIINTLISCHGNVTKAARQLGISRQSLIYRIKKYNIK